MFQSPILDVATGLILVFLVLALVCTSINEYVAQILGLRAEVLWRAVCSLFQNVPGNGPQQFARMVYDHDMVDALSPPGANPSYIPSHVYSLALVDVLGIKADPAAPGKTIDQLVTDAKTANANIADAAKKIDPKIYETIRPLAVASGTSIDQFRQNLESWFDTAMQRASGWYKRRIQVITFVVAFGATLIFNADALMVTDTLWTTPAARAQLTTDAQSFIKATPPAAVTAEATKSATQTQQSAPQPSSPQISAARTDAMKLIGWTGKAVKTEVVYDPHKVPYFRVAWGSSFPWVADLNGTAWFRKLLGLLITTLAACLGAPFWFGALSKVVSIRSAGPSPSDTTKQPERIASA